MKNKKKFEVGIFALNSSSGIAMTRVKERWKADWEDIENVARMCDKEGLDFIIAVQRWLGFGGKTNPAGLTYDSSTFCSALASITKNIKLYCTLHVPIVHPTFAARSLATIDHVSKGRAALNIVCGWNEREFRMFEIYNHEHINRYDEGEEWTNLLKKILSKKRFSKFTGKYYNNHFATTSPKLYRRDKIETMSAAFSKEGRSFAAKNVDSLITMFSNISSLKKQIKNIKQEAKKYNNKIKVYGLLHIVCRKTDKEAQEYYKKYADQYADIEAASNFISILNKGKSNSVLANLQKSQLKKMAGGIGSYPVVGSPKTVLSTIKDLKKAKLDGIAIGFVNFKDELPYFIKKVYKNLQVTN